MMQSSDRSERADSPDTFEAEDNSRYYLKPGFVYVSRESVLITTVLGSCVSVALYDWRLKIGGMNHFLLPYRSARSEPSTMYGEYAMPQLVSILLDFGSSIDDMTARITGGAYMEKVENSMVIAELNVSYCRKFLIDQGIAIAYENTGGTRGRKAAFHTDTGTMDVTVIRDTTPETFLSEFM
jgi:chemotaxis protein CheD